MNINDKKLKRSAAILSLAIALATSGGAIKSCTAKQNNDYTTIADEIDYEKLLNDLLSEIDKGLCIVPEHGEGKASYLVPNGYELLTISVDGINVFVGVRSELAEILYLVDDIKGSVVTKSETQKHWIELEQVEPERESYGLKVPAGYVPYYIGEGDFCGFWSIEEYENGYINWASIGYSVDDYVGINKDLAKTIRIAEGAIDKMGEIYNNTIEEKESKQKTYGTR